MAAEAPLMSNRAKGVPSDAQIKAGWPHQVEIEPGKAYDDNGWSERHSAMERSRQSAGGVSTRRTQKPGVWSDSLLYCFANRADAWAFHDRFGGHAFSVETLYGVDKLGWPTRRIIGYREIPR